jgi:hypothetical protein
MTLGGSNAIDVPALVFQQHEEFRHGFCAANAFFILPQGGSLLQRGLLLCQGG